MAAVTVARSAPGSYNLDWRPKFCYDAEVRWTGTGQLRELHHALLLHLCRRRQAPKLAENVIFLYR